MFRSILNCDPDLHYSKVPYIHVLYGVVTYWPLEGVCTSDSLFICIQIYNSFPFATRSACLLLLQLCS